MWQCRRSLYIENRLSCVFATSLSSVQYKRFFFGIFILKAITVASIYLKRENTASPCIIYLAPLLCVFNVKFYFWKFSGNSPSGAQSISCDVTFYGVFMWRVFVTSYYVFLWRHISQRFCGVTFRKLRICDVSIYNLRFSSLRALTVTLV